MITQNGTGKMKGIVYTREQLATALNIKPDQLRFVAGGGRKYAWARIYNKDSELLFQTDTVSDDALITIDLITLRFVKAMLNRE